MYRRIEKGFTVFRNGDNLVWVAPHSGFSFETPTSRDWNSDTVASLCWIKTGGSLVLSTITRKRIWGIDFNRDPPSKEHALKMYPEFQADKDRSKLAKFRSKYAFVARNVTDYHERAKIYESFWTTVGNLGTIIINVHRKFSRMKNYPSLIDIVAYEGKGVDKETVKEIISQINLKYGKVLKRISNSYKKFILTDTKRVCNRISRVFGDFAIENLEAEEEKYLKEDIEVIRKFATQPTIHELEKKFTKVNYLKAVKEALKKPIIPEVTLEQVFKGRKALSAKSKFFNKQFLIMEAEVTAFLGYWHPQLAAKIILDIVSMLRGAKLYKHLGIRQTSMSDFIDLEDFA